MDVRNHLIIDLEAELTPLRDLMIYPLPVVNNRFANEIIFKIIECVQSVVDFEYQASSMCVDCMDLFFTHLTVDEKDRHMEILYSIAKNIKARLESNRMYIGGTFPYGFESTDDFCIVKLARTKFASIMLMHEELPTYRFNI